MNDRLKKFLTGSTVSFLLLLAFAYFGVWRWGFCRVYVPPGQSLLLRYKGPWPIGSVPQAPQGELVSLGKSGYPERVGILQDMPGPGRHFYTPLEYERELVDDIIIKPGEIGLVTAKIGKDRSDGAYVADEGFKGIQRKILTPGRYRVNPYAYQIDPLPVSACVGSRGGVKHNKSDATLIPPGYVGVVTNNVPRAGESPGIQPDVLQPGIYYINPKEKRIDLVSIGFNETTLQVLAARNPDGTVKFSQKIEKRSDALAANITPDPLYIEGKGIQFPSNDGFDIHLDYTAIWGVLPDQAPDVVRQFGEIGDVEEKVILPQINSICRIYGSKRGAVELLVGETREAFQTDTAEELERVLESKKLKLLFGLTRHIYVPAQVREPIQQGKISEELKKTREQEQLTQKAAADLAEAKAMVEAEEVRTGAETDKLVAEALAEGKKMVSEIGATTGKLTAKIDAEAAQIQAQITKTVREAAAKKVELSNQARAELAKKSVEAFGGPEAYNRYMFADKLPADMKLSIFYAGPGTLWTDLKGFEQTMLGKAAAEAIPKPTSPAPTASVSPR